MGEWEHHRVLNYLILYSGSLNDLGDSSLGKHRISEQKNNWHPGLGTGRVD